VIDKNRSPVGHPKSKYIAYLLLINLQKHQGIPDIGI
jgi:hypothetical protein